LLFDGCGSFGDGEFVTVELILVVRGLLQDRVRVDLLLLV